ncbi:hypothetical protein ABIQ69_11370 [Agromyces sp. G08B096]|uniref:Uncharacterized protein n=1 Tax=Agromyces sp. G08B096 TaxID=3156399 RepID=A0AAU7W3N2_9MICO
MSSMQASTKVASVSRVSMVSAVSTARSVKVTLQISKTVMQEKSASTSSAAQGTPTFDHAHHVAGVDCYGERCACGETRPRLIEHFADMALDALDATRKKKTTRRRAA